MSIVSDRIGRNRMSRSELIARWCYLPRLLRLLWEVGARDVLVIGGFALVIGLAPLLVVVSLQRLVDAAVALLQGRASLYQALLWALALFLANLLGAQLEAVGDASDSRSRSAFCERLAAWP